MRSLALLLLVACNGKASVQNPDDTALSATSTAELNDPFITNRHCPPDSAVTWQSFGQGFLLDHCVGCHSDLLEEDYRMGAPLDADFNTQQQTQDWLVRLYERAADENTTMPPVDSVSAEQRYLFGEWLACGAP